ncbi:protein scarlet-like isoform X2 [Lycorma delicatula]|uniref:protein scarlet-like isoform X2 n=1 Tax=Lycorma delicatula TaxID=130591 RepID=UPI003F510A21
MKATNNYIEVDNFSSCDSKLTLSWHNLSVWVKNKDEEKSTWFNKSLKSERIIDKVSGIAESGCLLAIMGPSGAGKTTLLATISQRLKGDITGEILVNGRNMPSSTMAKLSGFVPQQDLTLRSLTVMEHMQLMARLKMDRNLLTSQRNQRVISLLAELGLTKCSNTRLSALSGGEMKKVSLGVEIINNPPLLFCDEPTTGLDSYNAGAVIEMLRQLAVQGKTVICTIHQPASGIFDMFHSVALLVRGGRLAYHGESDSALAFFNSVGLVCPTSYNLSEFLVSQLVINNDIKSQQRADRICSQFNSSEQGQALAKKLQIELTKNQHMPCYFIDNYLFKGKAEDEFQTYISIQTPSYFTQTYWLTWRSLIEIKRNPQDQIIRLAFYMFIALLISTPYIGMTVDQKGIQNMQGFLYLVVVETVFTFSYSVCHTFPAELPVLLREIGNGLYSPGPYYASKMIILLPRALLEPILYSSLVFWIAGLFGGVIGCLKFCIPVIACAIAATAYGCLISAAFESVATGSLASVPVEQISLIFCGIFMSLSLFSC